MPIDTPLTPAEIEQALALCRHANVQAGATDTQGFYSAAAIGWPRALEEVKRLHGERLTLRAALERAIRFGGGGNGYCQACGQSQKSPHLGNCYVGQALGLEVRDG